ncbi:hypothetical protein PR048_030768 [Dryococelus australis]|uniref:Uncharacterized protein n=1 Tax=Dryococelus australis TaxID=614101 RepID=A0ABQ9G9W6_9NEOP|nr:hypothetical protein PR048_030768 [Dryococelus australis]
MQLERAWLHTCAAANGETTSAPLGSPLIEDRPITNAVKYRVLSGVVWTNRTMAGSNTDTFRTGVLALLPWNLAGLELDKTLKEILPSAQAVGFKSSTALVEIKCYSMIKHSREVSMEQRQHEGEWGKREIPEKTRRPAASSGTIPKRENPGGLGSRLEPQFGNQPYEKYHWARVLVMALDCSASCASCIHTTVGYFSRIMNSAVGPSRPELVRGAFWRVSTIAVVTSNARYEPRQAFMERGGDHALNFRPLDQVAGNIVTKRHRFWGGARAIPSWSPSLPATVLRSGDESLKHQSAAHFSARCRRQRPITYGGGISKYPSLVARLRGWPLPPVSMMSSRRLVDDWLRDQLHALLSQRVRRCIAEPSHCTASTPASELNVLLRRLVLPATTCTFAISLSLDHALFDTSWVALRHARAKGPARCTLVSGRNVSRLHNGNWLLCCVHRERTAMSKSQLTLQHFTTRHCTENKAKARASSTSALDEKVFYKFSSKLLGFFKVMPPVHGMLLAKRMMDLRFLRWLPADPEKHDKECSLEKQAILQQS